MAAWCSYDARIQSYDLNVERFCRTKFKFRHAGYSISFSGRFSSSYEKIIDTTGPFGGDIAVSSVCRSDDCLLRGANNQVEFRDRKS